MGYVTIPVTLEMEFAAGVWTDMTALGYVDSESNITWKRGVGSNRQMFVADCSFSLDNATEDFTPGNRISTYFNKLRRGIGVRLTCEYDSVTYPLFRGIVTDLRPVFPSFGPARMRVSVTAKGISLNLMRQKTYFMELQQGQTVDAAASAIMDAAGWSLYDFEASDFVAPYVYQKSDALTDLISAWQSDPTQLLFEAGDGKLKTVPMLGGYASPDHTWGTTIVPDGDLVPDFRWDAQYSRQMVQVGQAKPAHTSAVELYRFPLTTKSGYPEQLEINESLFIRGTFSKIPLRVNERYGIGTYVFADSGGDLYAAITSAQTTVQTLVWGAGLNAPNIIKELDLLLIGPDIMRVQTYTTQYIGSGSWLFTFTVQRNLPFSGTQHAHASGTSILVAKATYEQEPLGQLSGFLNFNSTSMTVTRQSGGAIAPVGSYLAINLDRALVTSVIGTTTFTVTYGITRNVLGVAAHAHQNGTMVHLIVPTYDQGQSPTRVLSTIDAAGGIPVESLGLTGIRGTNLYSDGVDVAWSGNRFETQITNPVSLPLKMGDNADGERFTAELILSGDVVDVTENIANVEYEQYIPGHDWLEDGPALKMTFGTDDVNHGKAYAMGSLRASRLLRAWLKTPDFVANLEANVDSILPAEMGDMVRWTGTGTWREKIDEFYRILGVSGVVDQDGNLRFSYDLAPADNWRDIARCWFTEFMRTPNPVGSPSLLPTLPEIYAPGLGTWGYSGSEWGHTFVAKTDSEPGFALHDTFAYAKVASPTPARLNVDDADMVVGVNVFETSASALTFGATAGAGLVFRSNSAGTNYWRAFANRTTGKVFLWNTTDGVPSGGDATYTVAKGRYPELEVKAQGNRIRLYVDCLPEPLVDITNTRFNTNTYAGMQVVANSAPNQNIRFRRLYAQGL